MVDRSPSAPPGPALSSPEGPPPLSEDIVELIASGVAVSVGTRDERLQPEAMLGIGVRVHPDFRTFTVYVPEALAAATVKNLQHNGEIAVALARPHDHKSVQIKGRLRELRRATEADRDIQAVGRSALVEQFAGIGIPRPMTRRLVWWPSLAIEIDVRHVYQQTPGPGAGELLARGGL